MNNEEKQYLRSLVADFRYSVVAELCNPYLSEGEKKKLISQKTSRTYKIPGSEKTTVTQATIRNWLRRYKQLGKQGLLPKQREDRGRPRSFSDSEAQAIALRLEKKPQLTIASAIRMLEQEGILTSKISSSAASRFALSNNLGRKDRNRMKSEEKDQRRFAFEEPLACVQADAMHSFPIPGLDGKKRKAILIAFIDDATRRILHAQFDFTEQSLLFEDGIRHILKAHGKMGKLYCDNGSTFVSNQTKRITETLGVHIIHSKPYRPQGRGKIERFFRTLRDQFLRPLDEESIKNLSHLNHLFKTWLEIEYHRNIHSSLGVTPLDSWISKTNLIKRMDPQIDIDEAFLHHTIRKVYNDSIISLGGRAFEAPPILIGKRVDVFYDPHPPIIRLHIKWNQKNYGEARPVDLYGNAKIKRNNDFTKEIQIIQESGLQNPIHFTSINK